MRTQSWAFCEREHSSRSRQVLQPSYWTNANGSSDVHRWEVCRNGGVIEGLEVFIDSSFKPSLQCKEGNSGARATVLMIYRGFAILTPAIFRPLYLAIVRPHIDYAVHASFPYLQKDIKLIERMQHLATRCVKSFRRLPYPVRLHELKLPRWSDTFSVLLSSRCTSCSMVTWTCLRRSSLNHQLLVTSEGTTSRSINHGFTLPGGKRLLRFVRPDRGIDCLYTLPKLRQCPASGIA